MSVWKDPGVHWAAQNSSSGDEDAFRVRLGRMGGGRSAMATGRGTSGLLGARLTKALKGGSGRAGVSSTPSLRPFGGDVRQRVVAKVSFRNHSGHSVGGGGGGGSRLLAHAQYLERDGAGADGMRGRFYDRQQDAADNARERLGEWADDKRHFRVMLAPESGARIVDEDGDLKGFTREVMDRMERDLGVGLDWVAVDHANTDNPHVHVILRGVRCDGVDLLIPRDYVAHGLREAARDVATGILGERSLADERLRLDREIEGRSLNRLDLAIARDLGETRQIPIQDLGRGDRPEFACALKARARELERMGLAREIRRNVLAFEPGWLERLEAARALDVRRELARGRLYEPGMGRVAGEVVELGPRGETPDRMLLVLETERHGRVLFNTGRNETEGLAPGSLAALHPAGRKAEIEALSVHSVRDQVLARADTELDRELDRIARGEQRKLPSLASTEAALKARAQTLEANGLGARGDEGVFRFNNGARDQLRQAELIREGEANARAQGFDFRDRSRGSDMGGVWTVREVKELFSGRAAVLERDREIAVAMAPASRDLRVGDQVALQRSLETQGQSLTRAPARELTRSPERGLGLGLGR